MGTLSQTGGLSMGSDGHRYRFRMQKLYQPRENKNLLQNSIEPRPG